MTAINYEEFYNLARLIPLAPWAKHYTELANNAIADCNHGHLEMWLEAINDLPEFSISSYDLKSPTVRIGAKEDCDDKTRELLYSCMQKLRPWRKGPFEIAGMPIETEWRSDWKWERLEKHIAPLAGKTVLDIGCGSGYHCWRMAGADARLVVGIEPYKVFVMQFWAIKKYIKNCAAWVLPLGIEDLPKNQTNSFDTIFSMGVFYHRKSPIDHLGQIKELLRPGGELVLETLVVDGDDNTVLVPEGRYAKMRNVWFLPSHLALEKWLKKLGFVNVRTVDITKTTTAEQRTTDWMRWESLKENLMLNNPDLTVEGYQAPTRAILIANKPC